MQIGYFSEKFPYPSPVPNYKYGGGEIVAYNLAINMAKRGHNVHVFTTSANSKDTTEVKGNLIIHRYGTIAQLFERNISLNMIFKNLKHEVDIIHVHVGSSPFELLTALLYARVKKKPLIATYHGDVIPSQKGFMYVSSVWIYNMLVKRVLDQVNVIISPSQYYVSESIFLKRYRDKIISIPNGINIEDFDVPYSKEECREKLGLPADKKIILFLGALHPKKGPDVLIKAMLAITSEVPGVELVMAGDGVMRWELEELVKKLNVDNQVRFAGFVENGLKPLYFKSADIFVLPSVIISESFGIANLEAMACGIPIVASRIGGIPDVVRDGENGLLVPPKDHEALATAIIYLLKNEDMRRRMGERGKNLVKNYTWDKVSEAYEMVYKNVIR